MRRIAFTTLFLLVFSCPSWSKLKKEDQEYLDDQFQALKTQVSALQKQSKMLADQLIAMTKQLEEMQKVEQDTRDEVNRDRRYLDTVDQSLRLQQMSLGQASDALKELRELLQNQQQKLNSALSGAAPPAATVIVAPSAVPVSLPSADQPAPATPRVYYVVLVESDKYTLGVGSGQHVQPGTRLALFQKGAPSVKVGEMQITDIVDENNCHAHLLTAGITVAQGDIVQIE